MSDVQEAALADLAKAHRKLAKRKRTFEPLAEARQDHPYTPEMVNELTRPVRLEITFDDPMKVREQFEVIARAIQEGQMVTRDHHRGIVRQRMDLHSIMRTCAKVLVYMNGRTPTGQRKRATSA